jgi:ribonuclease P protein component
MTTAQHTFPRGMKLRGAAEFKAVYAARRRRKKGPLLVWTRCNDLPYPRLGLAVSRKVGTAPIRNTIKRRLRESFRMLQHEWPAGYDLVVRPIPHAPLPQAEYQRLLSELITAVGRTPNHPTGDNGESAAP